MGTFEIQVRVRNPMGGDYEKATMTVDTGASYSKLPSSLLEKLGIEPEERTYPVTLADDRVEEYPIGQASFEIAGRSRISPVLFGEEGIALLGATSLQALGLIPDTQNHELVDAKLLLVGMKSADNSATGNPL